MRAGLNTMTSFSSDNFNANNTYSNNNEDVPIIQTADDALRCKQATVTTGYYSDPFLNHMMSSSSSTSTSQTQYQHQQHQPRHHHTNMIHDNHNFRDRQENHHQLHDDRHHSPHLQHPNNHHHHHLHHYRHINNNHHRRQVQPIIKRGTYARVCVMDRAIHEFLQHVHDKGQPSKPSSSSSSTTTSTRRRRRCQIVVLGSGKDTSYFRLANKNLLGQQQQQQQQPQQYPSNNQNVNRYDQDTSLLLHVDWYEVDHRSVIDEKANLIRSSNLLSTFCPNLLPLSSQSSSSPSSSSSPLSNVQDQHHRHGYTTKSPSNQPSKHPSSKTLTDDNDEEETATTNVLLSSSSSSSSSSSDLTLVGYDLRDSPTELLNSRLRELDPTLPTLFLMECVSMYLYKSSYQELIQAIVSWSESSSPSDPGSAAATGCDCDVTLVCYEALLGPQHSRSNPFGTMMEQNLIRAKVALPGSCLLTLRTLEDQLNLLVRDGDKNTDENSSERGGGDEIASTALFDHATGCDMWSAYQSVITPQQRSHANSAEFLDEYEEFVLIMQHYSLIVATKFREADGIDDDGASNRMAAVGLDSPMGFQNGSCVQKTRKV